MEYDQNYDVIVIGGGTAGLSAALVLTRARRRVLVVDARAPRNDPAAHMHGYLSRDGMPPLELLEAGRDEVLGYGGVIVTDFAEKVEPNPDQTFTVVLASGCTPTARQLLVTTGLTDRLPDIPGMAEHWGADVHFCPYCHGWEVRDQALGEIATGPNAVPHALMIRQWSDDLVFFANGTDIEDTDRLKLEARGIRIVPGRVARVVGEGGHVTGVELEDGTTVQREALFVVPGVEANNSLLSALGCETDEETGWIRVDRTGATSVPGVWAAGNVVDPMAKVATAAGAAVFTATQINAQLVVDDTAAAVAAHQAAAEIS